MVGGFFKVLLFMGFYFLCDMLYLLVGFSSEEVVGGDSMFSLDLLMVCSFGDKDFILFNGGILVGILSFVFLFFFFNRF